MPIYEYRCSACGHKLEALQKLSEAPLVACPSCKAAALVKQVSAAGFHLKGSGWYATDFKGSQKARDRQGGRGQARRWGEAGRRNEDRNQVGNQVGHQVRCHGVGGDTGCARH